MQISRCSLIIEDADIIFAVIQAVAAVHDGTRISVCWAHAKELVSRFPTFQSRQQTSKVKAYSSRKGALKTFKKRLCSVRSLIHPPSVTCLQMFVMRKRCLSASANRVAQPGCEWLLCALRTSPSAHSKLQLSCLQAYTPSCRPTQCGPAASIFLLFFAAALWHHHHWRWTLCLFGQAGSQVHYLAAIGRASYDVHRTRKQGST